MNISVQRKTFYKVFSDLEHVRKKDNWKSLNRIKKLSYAEPDIYVVFAICTTLVKSLSDVNHICFPLREVLIKKHLLSLGVIELHVTTNRFEESLMTILSPRKFPTRTWTAFRSLQGTSLVASDLSV